LLASIHTHIHTYTHMRTSVFFVYLQTHILTSLVV
jgi:hypothetical protein